MNRHASAEHVELLLAAMPRGVAEEAANLARRRGPRGALKVHIKELEDAGLDEEDENMVEAREALAKAQRDARRRVVDLGCGAGRDFPAFEERNIDYLGVDASEGMLTVARERFPEATFEAAGVRSGPARAQLRRRLRQRVAPARADARPCRTRSPPSTRASGRAESY